ncbi:MAG: GNAT family N-acetyltransferase [Candidatus Aenigmarchaeota archaeon]|nr:GNAT family N-acetyltransferase [Candidatus Aenigmarchaeota archaeon]
MIIRRAAIGDFEALKEIKTEFFRWECEQDSMLDPAYIKRVLGMRLAKNIRQKNTVFVIAEENGKVIGFAGAEIKKNGSDLKARQQGHLFSLYVRPNHRRKGIAEKLLNEVMKWFKEKKIDYLTLERWDHNKIAASLYRKFGYRDRVVSMFKA